jgi:hypothetical protein
MTAVSKPESLVERHGPVHFPLMIIPLVAPREASPRSSAGRVPAFVGRFA